MVDSTIITIKHKEITTPSANDKLATIINGPIHILDGKQTTVFVQHKVVLLRIGRSVNQKSTERDQTNGFATFMVRAEGVKKGWRVR